MEEEKKRPVIAESFYWEDSAGIKTEAFCMVCGKHAVVKDVDTKLYCSRCWEFK